MTNRPTSMAQQRHAPDPQRQAAEDAYLGDVLSASQKWTLVLLLGCWLVAQLVFWTWWIDPHHVVSVPSFLLTTALLSWFTLLPAYYFFFLFRMKHPNPRLALPVLRVAMVVTKAPAEPWAVLKATLRAMLAQEYPHDTWLADEDPTPETRAWCQAHGVEISTRNGVADYHRPVWPRRTRCKEGNLAYFYDQHGYAAYDVVVQLDADHRPSQGYLDEMLRPFRDPAVGYVSAPSLCDSNSATSWSARGRLYAEATLHGSLQAGYTSGWAPLCIGSHYAVRTHALHSIGGLGPELAEDHSTTLLMNAQGWKGVHAVNAIAHGDGPLTFADCMTQEFQWSRSLTVILLTLLPTHWRQLPLKLKCQFFFSELWYPLFGLTMLAGYSMPVFALLTDTPLVNVAYIAFIWHAVPVTLCVIVIVLWAKQCGWTRPVDAKVLSWESALFQLTRWPWILLGCGAGVVGVVTGKTFSFRVTPKVKDATYSMSLRLMTPYFGIIGITLISVLYSSDVNSANGYYYLALFNSAVYTIVVFFLAVNEMRITRLSTMLSPKHWLKSGIVTGLGLVLGISIAFRGDDALTGILYQGKANVEQIVVTNSPKDPDDSREVVIEETSLGFHEVDVQNQHLVDDGTEINSGVITQNTVNLGVYDPEGAFSESPFLAIEHVFIQWNTHEPAEVQKHLTAIVERQRWPLITVEPYPLLEKDLQKDDLLDDIAGGKYDDTIMHLCDTLARVDHPFFLRWGHEMENLTGRYPWATADSAAYVTAYRRVIEQCRSITPNGFYVWSPAGNANLLQYWPGSEYVDYVGVSVFAASPTMADACAPQSSFQKVFGERYRRVEALTKPVMITELGIQGEDTYRAGWLAQALTSLQRYPLVKTVVYFNARDSAAAWGNACPIPDWRVEPSLFRLP